MFNLFPLNLRNAGRRAEYLQGLGVCPAGMNRLMARMDALCIQAEGLDSRAANILKQDMLSLGGDLAVPESVSRFEQGPVRVLLMGTRRHFGYLLEGLHSQPYRLREFGAELSECLRRMERTPSLVSGSVELFRDKKFLLAGVVNVTPDSFSDGGEFLEPREAVARGLKLMEDGADILDIGGESSRSGSEPVSAGVEIGRVIPVIRELKMAGVVAPISVDTTKSEVAAAALDEGATIINDISGGTADAAMLPLAARRGASVVLMHMRGTPKDMQDHPRYKDPLGEVIAELRERVTAAEGLGIGSGRIAVDPGIGFAKRAEDNLALIAGAGSLASLGHPVMIGASRKSLVGKLTGAPVGERVPGSIALHVAALLAGASIFRVHDVKEHLQALGCASELA